MMSEDKNEEDTPFEEGAENITPLEETAPPDAAAPEPGDGPDVDALLAEIEELKAERLRALAEVENAKKQADRRIQDNTKYAVSNFAKSILNVADNLERALMAAPENQRAENDALNTLAIGIEMTEKELQNALQSAGVKRLSSLDQPFDPNKHQAMQEVENTAVPAGTVVQVMAEGYMQHDRLLRPAMVVVSKGGPKREAAPKPDDQSAAKESGASDSVDTEV